MTTAAQLKEQTVKDLGDMAKKLGVPGWHAMRKDQLVRALVRASSKASKSKSGSARRASAKTVAKTGAKSGPAKSSSRRAAGATAKAGAKPSAKSKSGVRASSKAAASSKASAKSKPAGKASAKTAARRKGGAASASNGAARNNGAVKKSAKGSSAKGAKSSALKASAAKNSAAKNSAAKNSAAKNSAAKNNGAARKLKAGAAKATASAKSSTKSSAKAAAKPVEKQPKNPRASKRIQRAHKDREQQKDLSFQPKVKVNNGRPTKPRPRLNGKAGVPEKDRIVLMVRDPYWLQAYWEVTRQSVQRAVAAMAELWHTARPVLRVLEVDAGSTTSSAERVAREIEIHGGVKNWYIDVKDPPCSYRVDLGYLAESGRFYTIARSNTVTTPRPGSSDAIDENWTDVAEDYERVFALSGGFAGESTGGDLRDLFEERLRRPMGSPMVTQFGVGAEKILNRDRDFKFELDAEMIIYGATKPDAHVQLAGEPVKLRPDGTFTVRLSMPDRRQVLPAVASSADGVEQRTIVLAVERNTKVMEPMIRESND